MREKRTKNEKHGRVIFIMFVGALKFGMKASKIKTLYIISENHTLNI